MNAIQQILCVRRSTLEEALGGLRVGFTTDPATLEKFQRVVAEAGEFGPRPALEEDPTFLQIIVQGMVVKDNRVLALFRKVRESTDGIFVETRHNAKIALFAGGHVEPVEASAQDILRAAQLRELQEEIVCNPPVRTQDIHPMGLVYRDATMFDKVHIGCVSLVPVHGTVTLPPASDEFDHIEFADPERLRALLPRMEGWGQILANAILDNQFAPFGVSAAPSPRVSVALA